MRDHKNQRFDPLQDGLTDTSLNDDLLGLVVADPHSSGTVSKQEIRSIRNANFKIDSFVSCRTQRYVIRALFHLYGNPGF